VFNNLLPDGLLHHDFASLNIRNKFVYFCGAFGWVLLSKICLHEVLDAALDSELDVSKLFIDLMAKHLAEELDFVVFVLVGFDCLNNRSRLINDNVLKPILLREISLEILFHRLPTLLILMYTFVIMLHFLQINIRNKISHLLLSIINFF
jgi:hypothetical protein